MLLCRSDGSLNPDAAGFSRHPLHTANLNGPWGRQKRWDYWCVTSTDCALSVTYADLDYLGLVAVSLLDFKRKSFAEVARVIPLGRHMQQPATVAGDDIQFRSVGLRCSIREQPGMTRLAASFTRLLGPDLHADITILRPATHQSLNVVIPWSSTRFQFTSKQNTLPASGTVKLGRREYQFGEHNQGFACLDYGRGIWPFATAWNWASASGYTDGHLVGLQFGGKWTEGTGFTENGIVVNGTLHKLGEELDWHYDPAHFMRPWVLASRGSERVRLTFQPFYERSLTVPLVFAGAAVHQCYGRFYGVVRLDDGTALAVNGLTGWAEEMRARW